MLNARRSLAIQVFLTLSVACVICACGSDLVTVNSGPAITAADAMSEDTCQSPPVRGFGFDRYGGWKGVQRAASGRFRVDQVDGVWWFITPDGHALFSNGPTGVDPVGDYIQGTNRSHYLEANLAKYGSTDEWARHTLARLCDLEIRTLGGWMGNADLDRFAGRIAYAVDVDFYEAMPRIRNAPPSIKPRRDVFDPRAEELARGVAAPGGLIERCAHDVWCLGVYPENEAPYAPSIIAGGGHLEAYLSMAAGAPGKRAVQDFFAARYADQIDAFNRVWATNLASFDDIQQLRSIGSCSPLLGLEDDICYLRESAERIADRYAFEALVAARIAQLGDTVLRDANPAMLNLGPRIVVSTFAPQVLQALAAPTDVMSVNNYDVREFADSILTTQQKDRLQELNFLSFDTFDRLRQLNQITAKPLLITEWFYRRFRAVTTFPPILPEVADGPAQANAYEAYMDQLLTMPFVVGEHWFQWVDQPIEGRFDGENQLIGIVDVDDNLNEPLASTMRRVNQSVIERRLELRQPSG